MLDSSWIKNADNVLLHKDIEASLLNQALPLLSNDLAPLMRNDYFVGLEIIEKSKNASSVLAACIFRVDKNLLFVPVIFKTGKLKPLHFLYIEKLKQMVPANETWANLLLSQAEVNEGDIVDKAVYRFTRSPETKKLTALEKNSCQEFLRTISEVDVKAPSIDVIEKRPTWVKKLASQNNIVFSGLVRWWGDSWVNEKQAATQEESKALLSISTGALVKDAGDKGYVIKDARTDTLPVWPFKPFDEMTRIQPEACWCCLQVTPDQTLEGFWMPALSEEKGIGVPRIQSSNRDGFVRGILFNEDGVNIVRTKQENSIIWTRPCEPPETIPWLSDINTISNGQTAFPLILNSKRYVDWLSDFVFYHDKSDFKLMEAENGYYLFDSDSGRNSATSCVHVADQTKYTNVPSFVIELCKNTYGDYISFEVPSSEGMLVYTNPANFKVVEISTIDPLNGASEGLVAKLKVATAKNHHGDKKWNFTVNNNFSGNMTRTAAAIKLARDLGVSAVDVENMLDNPGEWVVFSSQKKSAAVAMRQLQENMLDIEKADFDPELGMLSRPYEETEVLEAEPLREREVEPRIDDGWDRNKGLASLPTESLMEIAQETGSKHLFEYGLLGAMANTFSSEQVINSVIPDLRQALDKIGRILFLIIWKPEDFVEAFGSDDISALELRHVATFKNLGDVTAELMQTFKFDETTDDERLDRA